MSTGFVTRSLYQIQASLLAVNFADDELNPVELGGLERAIAQVSTVAP